MYSYFFKRCISMVFILMILFINIFSCYCVVHADTQSSGGHFGSETDLSAFNKVYEGFDFSDTISKHESFYFSDSVGNKHAVARVGTAWICLFGTRATFNGSQDEQLNYYLSYYAYTGYKSISNSFGSLLSSKLGSITKGGYTLVENALSSNISNVASGISYNESDDSISFDSSSIDKLREEIIKQYYSSIGCFYIKSSGKPFNAVNDFKTKYEYDDELNSDLTASNNFDSAISFKQYSDHVLNYFWDDSDFDYLFFDNCGNGTSYYPKVLTYSNDGLTKHNPCGVMTSFYGTYSLKNGDSFKSNKFIGNYNGSYIVPLYNKDNIAETNFLASKFDCNGYFDRYTLIYYSKTGKPFTPFKSYSAYYNFINGNQNAYLSSLIYEKGRDLQFSINNMSQNFTEQMDKLIDNINSNKSNMSADELQDAIDKGLEDLNKNTEDIKDNTSDILDILKEQNAILLDILGVTSNIYKVVKETDSKDKTYNINYVQSVFNSMFKGLKNAIFYGKNTVRDDIDEDTDDISSIVSDVPPEEKNYHNGLFGRFPFSVPYQLFDWLQVLYVEPVAPKFSLSYAYLFEDLGYETNNFKFIIDLGDEKYSKWIELVRSGEKLSFIIYMAIATYHRFKNEI